MDLFASLVLVHLIADFPLQTNGIYQLKRRHRTGVLLHAGIHTLMAALLIQNPLRHWPLLSVLCLVHYIIDWLKLRLDFKYQSLGFILDQIVHVLSLALLTAWSSDIISVLPPGFLYPAVAYALIPALLMFLSVLTVDLEDNASGVANWTKKKATQIVLLSHLVGYPLVVGVVILRLGE